MEEGFHQKVHPNTIKIAQRDIAGKLLQRADELHAEASMADSATYFAGAAPRADSAGAADTDGLVGRRPAP